MKTPLALAETHSRIGETLPPEVIGVLTGVRVETRVIVGPGVIDAGCGVAVLTGAGLGVADAGRGMGGGKGADPDARDGGGGLSTEPGEGTEVLVLVAPRDTARVGTAVCVG